MGAYTGLARRNLVPPLFVIMPGRRVRGCPLKRSTGTRYEVKDDSFGTRWVVFEDLVSTIHIIAETIHDHGFGDRLLAAVFKCEYDRMDAYWIFSYKRGAYHPMVQSSDGQRDNAAEMRMGAIMEEEGIPIKRNLESWYSLSGIPF